MIPSDSLDLYSPGYRLAVSRAAGAEALKGVTVWLTFVFERSQA